MTTATTNNILGQIRRGKQIRPRRVLVYGTHGIGKSTFGAMAPAPIFIQTEDGLANIECDKFPLATEYSHVIESLSGLYYGAHSYQTVEIDSLDWLERLIWKHVCKQGRKPSIDDFGYGKGYKLARDQWSEVLDWLLALYQQRGMNVVLIAHAQIERYEDPATEGYDRYSPALHKYASATVLQWCDEILFANYKVSTMKVDESFGKATRRGVGVGDRVLYTTERPSHLAKNRLNLPDEIPLDYNTYAWHVQQFYSQATQTTQLQQTGGQLNY